MPMYRKKAVVEARQFIVSNWEDLEKWGAGKISPIGNWKHKDDVLCMMIKTATHPTGEPFGALPGQWIIKDDAGELSICGPDIFAATYEAVEVG